MISNGATSTTTTADAAASSSSNTAAQSLGLKNFFKTPGRYKLLHDKTHPSSLLPYALAKSITQSDSVEAVSRKGILMEMVMIKDMVMVVILAESNLMAAMWPSFLLGLFRRLPPKTIVLPNEDEEENVVMLRVTY